MKTRVPIQDYLDAIKEIQDAGEYPSGRVVGRRVGECRQTAEKRIRTAEKLGLVTIGLPPQFQPRDEIPHDELWQRATDVRLARIEEIEAREDREPSDVQVWLRDWRDGDISRSFRRLFRDNKNSASGVPIREVSIAGLGDRHRKGYY